MHATSRSSANRGLSRYRGRFASSAHAWRAADSSARASAASMPADDFCESRETPINAPCALAVSRAFRDTSGHLAARDSMARHCSRVAFTMITVLFSGGCHQIRGSAAACRIIPSARVSTSPQCKYAPRRVILARAAADFMRTLGIMRQRAKYTVFQQRRARRIQSAAGF